MTHPLTHSYPGAAFLKKPVFQNILGAVILAVGLAGCNVETAQRSPARATAPVPQATLALMAEKETDRNAPVLIRAYKKESEIEIWKQNRKGDYVLLKSYPVCRWSGQLGPKRKEGDRQVPEGFYTVSASQMNPFSSYWLAFNVGYPNPLEKSMGRSGGDIMVHGTCSSRGCFAMTDAQIEEIYAVMREAFNAGQKNIQFQSYPFHMTAENLAKFRHDPNMPYWKNLKEGSDHFEVTKREPKINYCGQRYVFNAETNGHFEPSAQCPSFTVPADVAEAVREKQKTDAIEVASLIEKGTQAVRLTYADGGQNEKFRSTNYAMNGDDRLIVTGSPAQFNTNLGDVSRPEALNAIHEVAINEKGETIGTPRPVVLASSMPSSYQATPAESVQPVPATKAETNKSSPATKPTGLAAQKTTPQQEQTSSGLFGATFSDLTNVFKAPSSSPLPATNETKEFAEDKNGFYNKLINVITPSPAEAETKPDLPAKVPLPPRRQAALNTSQIQ
jgi:murein L,D-transpeptidase YafK